VISERRFFLASDRAVVGARRVFTEVSSPIDHSRNTPSDLETTAQVPSLITVHRSLSENQGTGKPAKICSTMVSLVTASASAS
jgi:hypothetical protein